MTYQALLVIFEKSNKIWKCCLLQIIGGALWVKFVDPYPANIFCPEMSAFMSAAYIPVHFRLDFIMVANTMNPDQIAPRLGPYCLQ